MMTDRTVLSRDTTEQLHKQFGDLLLPEIPRRVVVGEANAAGQDIFGFDPEGPVTEAFAAMVEEVMARG